MKDRTLTIISKAEPKIDSKGDKRAMVNVLCFCGKEFVSYLSSINQGVTQSCGCLILDKRLERFKENPNFLSKHPLYRVWLGMKTRCFNPNSSAYAYYGGRGITMCQDWRDDFTIYYKWCVRNGYKKGLHIDRIDNNGNYEPENCRFATPTVNQNNRINTVLIPYNGELKTIKEWSETLEMSYGLLYSRIHKLRMTPEAAFSKPKIEYMLIDIELSENLKSLLKMEGRSQRWLSNKLTENGCQNIDAAKMSNKLNGIMGFTKEEIDIINKVLGTTLQVKEPSEETTKHIR